MVGAGDGCRADFMRRSVMDDRDCLTRAMVAVVFVRHDGRSPDGAHHDDGVGGNRRTARTEPAQHELFTA